MIDLVGTELAFIAQVSRSADRKMKKLLLPLFAIAALYALPSQALILTPADMIPQNLGPANCEPDCIEDYFDVSDLDHLYTANVQEVGTSEEGFYAGSYQTTFSNTAFDPADALIEYVGGAIIGCPVCYLAVKDGAQDPSYYFYDLAAWNGVEDLDLRGFWPQQGAISHVSIWGVNRSVPEPATLGLLGAGLLLVGLSGKRRSKNRNA
jgi:hypothetical protein